MRYLIFILPLFMFFVACSGDQAPDTSTANFAPIQDKGPSEQPDISIQIANMTPGKTYLIGLFADKRFRYDSAMVDNNGYMKFNGSEPYPSGIYYAVFPDGQNIQLLIDTDQSMEITTDANDLIATSQVKGNLETQLLFDNLRYENQYQQSFNQKKQANATPEELAALGDKRMAHLNTIFDKYPNAFFTSFKRAGQNPEVLDYFNPDGTPNNSLKISMYRQRVWDNVDFNDDRLIRTPVIMHKLNGYIEQMTPQSADSLVSATSFLVNKVLDKPEYFKLFTNNIALRYPPGESSVMDAEKLFVFIAQNYFTKERAFWSDSMNTYSIQQRAGEMAASLTGLKGPNVQSTDPNGQTRAIYDLKSDYIIVYMYNPTCEHCMIESPKLVQLYAQTTRKDLDVYAIAIDTDEQEWKEYIKKLNMKWTNVFDPTNASIYGKYFADITPEIYILNPDRTIIAKNLKVDQIQQMIQKDRNK